MTFYPTIYVILKSVIWQYTLVYLDSIVVFSKIAERHIEHILSDLTLFQRGGVTLKPKKRILFTNQIDYLRHVKWLRQSQIASSTADAIRLFQQPPNISEMRSFLGLCDLFRRLVSTSARTAALLDWKLPKELL